MIGLWTGVPLGLKYQIATELANTNYDKASKKALIHNPPKMKNPNTYFYSLFTSRAPKGVVEFSDGVPVL